MRNRSQKGESKISAANDYLGEFHMTIKNKLQTHAKTL